jgi:hypothetical protein
MTAAPTAEAAADVAEDRSLLEAIRAALIAEMERDERVVLYGTDVGIHGGVLRVAIADETGQLPSPRPVGFSHGIHQG